MEPRVKVTTSRSVRTSSQLTLADRTADGPPDAAKIGCRQHRPRFLRTAAHSAVVFGGKRIRAPVPPIRTSQVEVWLPLARLGTIVFRRSATADAAGHHYDAMVEGPIPPADTPTQFHRHGPTVGNTMALFALGHRDKYVRTSAYRAVSRDDGQRKNPSSPETFYGNGARSHFVLELAFAPRAEPGPHGRAPRYAYPTDCRERGLHRGSSGARRHMHCPRPRPAGAEHRRAHPLERELYSPPRRNIRRSTGRR